VFLVQGIYCKALSLGNGQSLGETLSVSFQDLKKNINTPSRRAGGVTGGIRVQDLATIGLHCI